MNKKKKISILCPIYNEQDSINNFYNEYKKFSKKNIKYSIDLIFSNNRSKDYSLKKIISLRNLDESVQYITLSRNFGYQISLQALLSVVDSDAIVIIDVDGEDSFELVNDFIINWEKGYDLIYGKRIDRNENYIIKKLRNLYYLILKFVGDADIVLYMAEYSLISKNMYEVLKNTKNTYPYLRTEMAYSGFERLGIEYKRKKRTHGRTSYNIFGMIKFGCAGLITSSTLPLRLSFILMPLIIIFNFFSFYQFTILNNNDYFFYLININLIYLIFSLGFLYLYIARMYKNSIGRPLFIIDKKLSKLNK